MSGYTVADPETSEGGPRNMTYKPPHAAAIFFWPIFYRPGGGPWPPWLPLDPLLVQVEFFHNYQSWQCCAILRSRAIFSFYSLKYAIVMNISKQITNKRKSVILGNLNSVKFSIHALTKKMYC